MSKRENTKHTDINNDKNTIASESGYEKNRQEKTKKHK
ncbi:MAG: hypothetical protein K0R06_169 [Clostridium sp.]|jgi:hypothetical protein|nr:hypothetical protein [Clostridium sp.]